MRKIIVHIGYPKCGSSALQHFLCNNQLLEGRKARYQYFVMSPKGIVPPADLRLKSRISLSGYMASIGSLGETIKALVEHLRQEDDPSLIPIISEEGWGSKQNFAGLADLPTEIADGISLEMIGYVRPQITWMQSAWWQWFAWRPDVSSIEDVWHYQRHTVKWDTRFRQAENAPCVHNTIARLQDSSVDIVRDFLELLDVDPAAWPAGRMVNTSVTSTHIGLYRRFPALRRPNDPRIDMLIQKLLPAGKPAPWAVPRALADRIIEEMQPENEALAARLDSASRARMMADQRWWSLDAYAGKWEAGEP